MSNFLWFAGGFLCGIFFLITLATYGVMKAKSRLGLDVLSMIAPTKLKQEVQNAKKVEGKDVCYEREAKGESEIQGICGIGNSSDKKEGVSRTEEGTSNQGRKGIGEERDAEKTIQ